jgi:prophage antirepressor-like protein
VKQFENFNIPIYGTFEEPLFKAKDIGILLDIKDIYSSIKDFDEDEKGVGYYPTPGGIQEFVMLTEQGLYKILMISRKEIAKKFQKWVFNVIKEIRLKGKYELEEKVKCMEKELEAKEQELIEYKQKVYEEIEKNEHLYVFSTDKRGVVKIGKTKNKANKRKEGLQTACVDDIDIIFDYHTHDSNLLETIVHYILDRYRCNSNREHFACKIEFIKRVIEFAGSMVNTLKSMFDGISEEEMIEKINENVRVNVIMQEIDSVEDNDNQDDIVVLENNVDTRDLDIYQNFINAYCEVSSSKGNRNYHVYRKALKTLFNTWKNENNLSREVSEKDFNKFMSKKFGSGTPHGDRVCINGVQDYGWYGVKLKLLL